MGFPIWTLWGMGLSSFGALIAVGLAFAAQSPKFLLRTRLAGYRLDLRARAFTGYGFALMLLALGFFLAGVPIGDGAVGGTAVTQITPTPEQAEMEIVGGAVEAGGTITATRPTSLTPVSGAFGGPPPGLTQEEDTVEAPTEAITTTAASPVGTALSGPAATPTPVPNTPTTTPSPTSTPTATPTVTPTPTLTPTPIERATAVIDVGGGTVWLRRSPDGQNMLIMNSGDTVILLNGHANRSGVLWREISTVQGETGWMRAEFLVEVDS
ncbi:MAG: hypothetical protein IPM39_14160 [Chloroflexi bacterium]|nr:hypothetical protein [Chloroflexota bacterium]